MSAENPTPLELQRAQKQAKTRLWRKGVLSWKFNDYPWQRPLYDFIRGNWGVSPHLDVMMHRRGGKSTVCLTIGIEECLRHAGVSTAVLCTTKEQAQAVCEESMTAILEDCPAEIYPRRIKNDFVYNFDHNESKIVILSADRLNAKAGRGRKFRFIHVMEAGFIPGIDKILSSVLSPTLRDVTGKTNGTMVLESTPSEEEDHPFERLWLEAEAEKRTFFLPLSANKEASPQFVESCKKDFAGGELSEDYQREYELKFGTGKNRTAIPEFTDARARQGDPEKGLPPIIREVPKPPSADRYTGLDPGGQHPTGELWGFYDFEHDLLVIEDEWLGDNVTSDVIASTTTAREAKLWGPSPEGKLYRIADNNNVILLRDLHHDHGLLFHATAKDDKDAQVNKLRVMIRDGGLAIHPRCVILFKTLRVARRHKAKRRGFEEQDGIGHADLLDTLLYIVRNVRKHQMPAPTDTQPGAAQRAWVAPQPAEGQGMAKKLYRMMLSRSLRRW